MDDRDWVAAALSRTSAFARNKVEENDLLLRITAGIPEAFSDDHKTELKISIRERYIRYYIDSAVSEFEKLSDKAMAATETLDESRIAQAALERTKAVFEKINISDLPFLRLDAGEARSRARTFQILKVTLHAIFLGAAFMFYKVAFTWAESFGVPFENGKKIPDQFYWFAAPISLGLAFLIEKFFRGLYAQTNLFQRVFGRLGAQYSGVVGSALVIVGPIAPIVFGLLNRLGAFWHQTPSGILQVLLFIPMLIGMLTWIFSMLSGGLIFAGAIYRVLVGVISDKLWGQIP